MSKFPHHTKKKKTPKGRFTARKPGGILYGTQINVNPSKLGACPQSGPSSSQPEGRLLMAECPRDFQSGTETLLRSLDLQNNSLSIRLQLHILPSWCNALPLIDNISSQDVGITFHTSMRPVLMCR